MDVTALDPKLGTSKGKDYARMVTAAMKTMDCGGDPWAAVPNSVSKLKPHRARNESLQALLVRGCAPTLCMVSTP